MNTGQQAECFIHATVAWNKAVGVEPYLQQADYLYRYLLGFYLRCRPVVSNIRIYCRGRLKTTVQTACKYRCSIPPPKSPAAP